MTIALAGQPNAGKSTIFNQIAGVRAVAANFPGTTVKYSRSQVRIGNETCTCVDLPGTYSLQAMDLAEAEARSFLLSGEVDVIVNVVDASLLHRSLEFTLELLELEIPMVVCLNMMDEAARKGMHIDTDKLSRLLGVPVVATVARTGQGIRELFLETIRQGQSGRRPSPPRYGRDLEEAIQALLSVMEPGDRNPHVPQRFLAVKLLEDDPFLARQMRELIDRIQPVLSQIRSALEQKTGRPAEDQVRVERHALATHVFEQAVKVARPFSDVRHRVDAVATHPYLGYLILGMVVYGVFFTVFRVGSLLEGPLLSAFDALRAATRTSLSGSPFLSMAADGLLQGLAGGAGIVFPYLIPFLLLLSLLEDVGYLPRAAVLMDAFFHRLGLHGKAIIPFVLGYGCNVPAVMATRILDTKRDRIVSGILSTMIPCSARTAIVFGLLAYFVGPWAAVFVYALNLVVIATLGRIASSLLPATSPGLILEIPPYRWPSLRLLGLKSWLRLREFITLAWPLLIGGSLVLSLIDYFQWRIVLDQIFSPFTALLGLPAAAGTTLVFGILRKELSLLMLIQALGTPQLNTVLSPLQMLTFTVFVLFYFPCVSTLAALIREIGTRWALAAVALTTLVATILALAVRTFGALLL
ncbi:MAG: ferrous iron transport protein B [candidate division KSB1 bacterium]|nr:ferrous iron transport protein B [candidate division KSB1 bacterium]